jgi:hypothetical protein
MADPRLQKPLFEERRQNDTAAPHSFAHPPCRAVPLPSHPFHSLQNFADQLDKTMTLAGDVVVQMVTNAATALKSAQTTLDQLLPGPDFQQVIIDLR